MKKFLKIFIIYFFFILSTSCSPNKGPFESVQMCLVDDRGVSEFFEEMKSSALEEKMKFVDRSDDSQKELESLNYRGVERSRGIPIINISAARSDGLSFGATNLGLSQYQVVVGFSEGRDADESRRFAAKVVKKLEQYWKVSQLPPGIGAMPMQGCK